MQAKTTLLQSRNGTDSERPPHAHLGCGDQFLYDKAMGNILGKTAHTCRLQRPVPLRRSREPVGLALLHLPRAGVAPPPTRCPAAAPSLSGAPLALLAPLTAGRLSRPL